MRLSHEDRVRQARALLEPSPPIASEPQDPPVQLTRELLDRHAARQVLVTTKTLGRFRQAQGGMRQFLNLSRSMQRHPPLGKGRRE